MSPLAQGVADGLSSTQDRLIVTAIIVVIAFALYWAAGITGRRYVRRMAAKGNDRGARASTLWTVLRRLVLLVVFITALLFVFSVWGWGLAPFLGIGTVLAAAVGFGAQDLVNDFLSGFFILMEDQFQMGDTVTLAGTTGTVEDIQLRVTVLRDLEGNVHFVPNGQITVTSNFTSRFAQPVIDIGVAYETDVDHALVVLRHELEGLAKDPEFGPLITADPEVLGVTELGDSSVVLRARLTTVAESRWTIRREALRRIKNRFEAEGISIPFPTVTINQKPQ